MLDERHSQDEQFVERFRREAKNAAGLSHPNIVSIYDRGQAEGTYYIAMEYLEGRTLKELLIARGPTPLAVAIDYARQILSALGFAHRHGIVHRDIKPHNVVVAPDGRLKVTDFGIARSGTSQMTETGSIIGTAQYLSPEQAKGAPVTPASDIYSVGIVLYEMLTGLVPFTGDTPLEIAMKHLSTTPLPPSEARPDVPHELDSIVLRALAKNPEDRYQSADEMDADLARASLGQAVAPETEEAATQVLRGAGAATLASAPTAITRRVTVVPPATGPPPPYSRPTGFYEYDEPMRRSFWPWLLAALLVAAAIVGGLVRLHEDPGPAEPDETGVGTAGAGIGRAAGRPEARGRGPPGARTATAERQRRDRAGVRPVPPARRANREGQPRRDQGLERQAEGLGAERGRETGDRCGRCPHRSRV